MCVSHDVMRIEYDIRSSRIQKVLKCNFVAGKISDDKDDKCKCDLYLKYYRSFMCQSVRTSTNLDI